MLTDYSEVDQRHLLSTQSSLRPYPKEQSGPTPLLFRELHLDGPHFSPMPPFLRPPSSTSVRLPNSYALKHDDAKIEGSVPISRVAAQNKIPPPVIGKDLCPIFEVQIEAISLISSSHPTFLPLPIQSLLLKTLITHGSKALFCSTR